MSHGVQIAVIWINVRVLYCADWQIIVCQSWLWADLGLLTVRVCCCCVSVLTGIELGI